MALILALLKDDKQRADLDQRLLISVVNTMFTQ